MTESFRLNSPAVVAESIDGEALIVHLGRGFYYSTDGSGEAIWNLAVAGVPLAELVAALQHRFVADPVVVEGATRDFLRQLLDEELLLPVAQPAGTTGAQVAAAPAVETRAPFHAPVLRKYTDMRELLMLDPIHEVDESGWPNPPSVHLDA